MFEKSLWKMELKSKLIWVQKCFGIHAQLLHNMHFRELVKLSLNIKCNIV